MGIFKKTEKETIYDDYDDESYRDEELLEEAEKGQKKKNLPIKCLIY